MQFSKRGFGLLGLLIILGLAIVGGGAFLYMQNKPTSQISAPLQTATTTMLTKVTPQSISDRLIAHPTQGEAPLTVTFTIHNLLWNPPSSGVYAFDFGDGIVYDLLGGRCPISDSCTLTHTYENAGSYTAKFYVGKIREALGPSATTTIIVTASTAQTSDGAPHAVFPFVYDDAPAASYTNSQYKFQILYPEDFTINAESDISSSQDEKVGEPPVFPTMLSYATTVASFTDNLNNSVIVEVSTNPQDIANCLVVPTDEESSVENVSEKTINGVVFKYYETGSAGAGMYSNDHVYKTLRNNTCYVIDNSITFFRDTDMNVMNEASKLDSIAMQFYFAN